jgi:hypothetical protein
MSGRGAKVMYWPGNGFCISWKKALIILRWRLLAGARFFAQPLLQTLSVPIKPELGGLVSYGPDNAPLYYMLMRQEAGMTISALHLQGTATRQDLLAAHRRYVVLADLHVFWLPAGSHVWNTTIKAPIPVRGPHASMGGPPTAAEEE